ncbi:U2 snRNP-associated SURP domain-containing protein [Balamuthia mandrillaris]
MEKEKENPLFAFLFEANSDENIYYRWKVFSLLQGGSDQHWSTEPFQMFPGGPFWIPPPLPSSPLSSSSTPPPPPPQRTENDDERRKANNNNEDNNKQERRLRPHSSSRSLSRSRSPSPHRRRRRSRSRSPPSRRSERDRHTSSSSREQSRDRERDRDRDRERDRRNNTLSRDRDRDRDRDRSRDRDRDRERERNRSRERDEDRREHRQRRERSSSIKAKELSASQRDHFEDLLRALTLSRPRIREAMCFALDHSECAEEVVEILTEALTLKETPVATKVARLFLVSDILHNSTAPVPNASAYRTFFERKLPTIFESMHDTLRSITGRMTSENLKEQVLRVLRVWEAWSLYPSYYLTELQNLFLKKSSQQHKDEKEEGMQQDREEEEAEVEAEAEEEEEKMKLERKEVVPDPELDGETLEDDLLPILVEGLRLLTAEEVQHLCITHGLTAAGTQQEMKERLALLLQ